ncbi:hypothetical protein [Novosphingobium sp. PhB165]|nr:hypothetical protein [Novosphingobium sp. PhB165]
MAFDIADREMVDPARLQTALVCDWRLVATPSGADEFGKTVS